MKEHPILFSGSMVRAILDGRKTQTRRVIVPQPCIWKMAKRREISWKKHLAVSPIKWSDRKAVEMTTWDHSPFGVPGDRLWVRETWFCDDYALLSGPYRETQNAKDNLYYRADDPNGDITNLIPECDLDGGSPDVWKPSIHMPHWVSRLMLEVVDVRVERIQEISEEDAKAEGAIQRTCDGEGIDLDAEGYETYFNGFRELWNSINAKRGFGWDFNPWVWAITFKRIES